MSKRFNNLNLTADQLTNPEFTEADVKSTKIQETQEKVDYATNQSDQVALLGTIVNNTTAEGNSAFNLKYIYRDRIRFNSNNDFEMDDIEGLADSLLSIGMQHNLSAFYDENTDDYVLESGERRLRACDMLYERYKVLEEENEGLKEEEEKTYQLFKANIKPFYDKGFPVNVKKLKHQDEAPEYQRVDVIDSELRKYKVNIDVRELSPQSRAGYIEKIRDLMKERNKLLYGEEATEPTKAEIAKAVGTSERQLRKYDSLGKLVPALREEFEAGNISINKIPSIAALPEGEQMVFLDLLQKGKTMEPSQIKAYKEHMEAAEQARRNAEAEKEQLENELEHIRSTKDEEISSILQESKSREIEIKKQIEQAVKEENEKLIMDLQNDLARERESSGRLISEANKSLERTKQALNDANRRLEEMSNAKMLQSMEVKAEIEVQISLLSQVSAKLSMLMSKYKNFAPQKEMENIAIGIERVNELRQLFSNLENRK